MASAGSGSISTYFRFLEGRQITRQITTHILLAGVVSLITYTMARRQTSCTNNEDGSIVSDEEEAGWLRHLFQDPKLENVDDKYREWTDEKWRSESGWLGCDFIHSKRSTGPRILRYFFDRECGMLIGVVKFGRASESHQGLCHGGSMTAVLDDVLGHTAFVCGKGPWTGATIQVNCSLKKAVVIGNSIVFFNCMCPAITK